ncbi:protein Wiz isoform X5 [Sorex araneus]|uniref:protein Wiz isoform X5 n=1 Tax=Sorex araneus TaxID=42254 RepID=UPI002433C977|nr:protein Wiz isoform X5 [Sorex araneus]
MDGPLAGGLVAPDHPCGPSRLPGPAPREDMDGGIEEAEGDSSIFQTTQYPPLSKEGPRDILDGQGSLSDGQPHPGLCEALPRASSASLRMRPCLDLRPGSPPRRLWGRFPGPPDGQGPWENTVHPEVGEGHLLEHRVEDLVIVRPGKELEGGTLRLSHLQSNPALVHKGSRGRPRLHWRPDREGPLHPALLPPPLCPALPSPSFQPVLLPPAINNDAQTHAMAMVEAPQSLVGLEGQAEWGLPRAASEVATQTWTVNAEASVERLPPRHPQPYLCGLLEEVAEGAADPEDDEEEEEDEDKEPAVFPCLECSIYFPHKAHLLEHMSQHRRAPGQEPPAHLTPLACSECGWAFADPQALQQHRRLHQASREKILEEIQKLKQVPAAEGWGAGLPGPHCALDDRPGEPLAATAVLACPPPGASSSGLQACWCCGFLASSETLLREHVRLAHAVPPWDGPSQEVHDCVPPAADYFGQEEPFLGPEWQDSPSRHSPSMELSRGCPPLGWTGPQLPQLPRASASCSVQLQQDVPPVPLDPGRYPWSDEEEEGSPLTPEVDAPPSAGLWLSPSTPGHIPPRALELRRTFWETLRAAEASTLQRRQLRWTVPVVLLPRVGPEVLAAMASRQGTPEALGLTGTHPLDLLLLDTPLGLDALLGGDPTAALRPEERRCPYCPDRFHNGIGLANHVRGHLNRVGVSYNVRHFISAEEVKAIERSCSFQKKKKKVANFDPGTFSLMRCDFCGAGFDTRAGLSSHARAHLRDFGITNWELTVSPISVLQELLATAATPRPPGTLLPARRARMPLPLPCPSGWPEDLGPTYSDASGPEPARDIRCEFCGEFFENRKGLSSHARSHLRQMGVTEWYVNGSPIDTLREILKRRTQSRPGGAHPPGHSPKALAKMAGNGSPGGVLEARSPADLHLSPLAKKLPPPPGSPLGHSPTASPPPTARKMFPGLAAPSLSRKLKPEQMRVEIKREALLHGEPHPPDSPWAAPREDLSPLNLSSRAEPVRDIRCEFCGEFFENRKGLSSHARSHLRQMGVTEWSVNGSPIDTLREILKKKTKPCLIKKEPPAGDLAPALVEDGPHLVAPGPMQSALPLVPMAGRPGKPGAGLGHIPRELILAPLSSAKAAAVGYLGSMAAKRPLQEDRLLPPEVKAKTYIQTELPFKAKALHDKASHSSTEACCELCGLYFENRKALASHARAHLRQFGVTEWCVNGSPIETLSEWIKHRPQKVGAYRSYIQGGRPFTKKFRSAGHSREGDKRPPLGLAPGGLALVGRSACGEPGLELGRAADGSERPLASSPPGTVKAEEHQRQNINKFERRQARPADASGARGSEDAGSLQQKLEEVRQPPPRVRPVPSLVPRPPQTSLVKFVGNIYTLKCRFCEAQFQGPLSIQEEWVRHLQRHILDMSFSKVDAPPEEPPAPQAQTAVAEAP